MRILFIGNSLTAGNTGVSFTSLIRKKNPEWKIVNRGVNGEPLYNIADRLIRIVKKDPAFDCIVIEAGINDILLPELEQRKGLFRWAIGRERRHDIKPLEDVQKFRSLYAVLLKEVRLYTRARIVLINVSRINECAPPALLEKQRRYNAVIAELASQANYFLADVASAFDRHLSNGSNTDYLCRGFWNTTFWDGLRCKFPGGARRLSVTRNLKLTIDGVHLNREGAQSYADTVTPILNVVNATLPTVRTVSTNASFNMGTPVI